MKKLLILLLAFTVCINTTFSQKPKPAATPVRPAPAPKGPPPYVLKKDYEPQMAELNAKVNAASGAAASVRRSVEGKFDQLVTLDSQMQNVQAILNSANFQIAMNADSLKETRFSMEELQKRTEDNFASAKASNDEFASIVWIVFGVIAVSVIVVLVVLLGIISKRMAKLQTILHQNEEIIKKSVATNLEKQKTELKDNLQSFESRVLVDMSALKREFTSQLSKEQETTSTAIQALSAKVDALGQTDEKAGSDEDNDPEVFI
jgi:hypothetical protein